MVSHLLSHTHVNGMVTLHRSVGGGRGGGGRMMEVDLSKLVREHIQ